MYVGGSTSVCLISVPSCLNFCQGISDRLLLLCIKNKTIEDKRHKTRKKVLYVCHILESAEIRILLYSGYKACEMCSLHSPQEGGLFVCLYPAKS